MRALLLGTVLSALCLGSNASYAASIETDAFVANVRLDASFLEKASSLAEDRSENADLRAFAGRETEAERAIVAVVMARTAPEVMAQAVLTTVASDDVVTGRSVAVVQADAPPLSAPAGTGALMPAALITLDRLSASKGSAFDTLYKATQLTALRQLAAFYDAYAMTGDDAALRQLSKSELAATNGRIAQIGRF